jgi:hypothetical protein
MSATESWSEYPPGMNYPENLGLWANNLERNPGLIGVTATVIEEQQPEINVVMQRAQLLSVVLNLPKDTLECDLETSDFNPNDMNDMEPRTAYTLGVLLGASFTYPLYSSDPLIAAQASNYMRGPMQKQVFQAICAQRQRKPLEKAYGLVLRQSNLGRAGMPIVDSHLVPLANRMIAPEARPPLFLGAGVVMLAIGKGYETRQEQIKMIDAEVSTFDPDDELRRLLEE